MSRRYTNRPTAAPTTDGIAATGPDAGRVRAAATPIAPNTTRPIRPARGRRAETIPIAMAPAASTTAIPTSNANLSLVPNVRIANSLSHAGVASIAAAPTASMGEDAPPTIPAISWAVPSAARADSTPMAAPTAPLPEEEDGGVSAGGSVWSAVTDSARPCHG